MEKPGSWERDSWSFWHQKWQSGTAEKAHCLDVSAKEVCSEKAHVGITSPLCLRSNSWLEKCIFKMKRHLVSPNLGTWEQILREAISRKDRKVNGNSQHRFIIGKSRLISLIAFSVMTGSVDEGKAVDVIFLDFTKAVITVSHAGQS